MKIAIIGLGYVGLPLAVAFSQKYEVIGYDLNIDRVKELSQNIDKTLEISSDELNSSNILFTNDKKYLSKVKVYIISVPTPVDNANFPNLDYVKKASEIVSSFITKDSYVIYESTVYPGVTEEICLPILESNSGLKVNEDFYLGYSPERINPGDKTKTISDIVKVTSGSCDKAASFIDDLYKSIITQGTFKASSIRVAEAAKVIENIQRDINIALINELSIIFDKLDIDTHEVLNAAKSKWNFHDYKPGLVGGHCIGIDPYYLKYKANQLGIKTKVIDAGRETNDFMTEYISNKFIKKLYANSTNINNVRVLIAGISFKENCTDIRNSKIIELIKILKSYSIQIDVYDPIVNKDIVLNEYKISMIEEPISNYYDGLIIAVKHKIFIEKGIKFFNNLCKKDRILFDLKGIFNSDESDMRL